MSVAFLAEHETRRVELRLKPGLSLRGLFLGIDRTLPLEIVVLDAAEPPDETALRRAWHDRLGRRSVPLLIVALHGETAWFCGLDGVKAPIRAIEIRLAERICHRALIQPDRNDAYRLLSDVLPGLDAALPGIRNEGLFSDHVLKLAALAHPSAAARGRAVLGLEGSALLAGLGFGIERQGNGTLLLRAGEHNQAVAVLLEPGETPEAGVPRFQGLSPVSWAIDAAERQRLDCSGPSRPETSRNV